MIECTAHFLATIPADTRAFGEQFFGILRTRLPSAIPQYFGDSEPPRNLVDSTDLKPLLDCWGSQRTFVAQRKLPDVFMHAIFGERGVRRHPSLTFFQLQLTSAAELPNFIAFVREMSELCRADYAMAHVLTQCELANWIEERRRQPTTWPTPPAEKIVETTTAKVHRIGFAATLRQIQCSRLYTANLQKCLPDLYWINVFGSPYIQLLTRARIIESGAPYVSELNYGALMVQLTDDLCDSQSHWSKYKSIRGECRDRLGTDIFCDQDRSKRGTYRTPSF